MIELIDFTKWNIYDDAPYGSGASEKIWLIDPKSNKTGIFKYPKIKTDGSITGEYWAEKVAAELSKLIGINCAEIDIGTYYGKRGSMSYNFLNKGESMLEGVSFITREYQIYNSDKMIDEFSGDKYSVQMIEKSFPWLFENIIEMIVFDALIGNSDRHHSNWGTIINVSEKQVNPFNNILPMKFAPLYDNGSSLCCRIAPDEVDVILKDNMRLEALIDSKSRSAIGFGNKRPIRHFELIEKMNFKYHDKMKNMMDKIRNNINENAIKKLIDSFENDIIDMKVKELLFIFLIKRCERLIRIYEGGSNG